MTDQTATRLTLGNILTASGNVSALLFFLFLSELFFSVAFCTFPPLGTRMQETIADADHLFV